MPSVDPGTDWNAWHDDYADPGSPLSERLRLVQGEISGWLDVTAPARVSVISSCAGDGRDLLGVLEQRDDAWRVTALLLETDPDNAGRASNHAARLGAGDITVRRTDAGASDSYADAAPADLLLLCGIFGNVSDEDVRGTIAAAPQLCAADALVIWTRHRKAPDLTPTIRGWFAEHGFREERFVAPKHAAYGVGVHRFVGEPRPLRAGQRLFTFIR